MPRTNGKSQDRTQKRAQEVLEAATKVFYERGYAATSVQDIADQLGILKGSLYYYIQTKEDLLYRVLESVQEDVTDILDGVLTEEGLNPLQRVALYVERQVEYNLTHLPKISVYHHDVDHLTGDRHASVQQVREAHARRLSKVIARGQEQGLIDPAPDARLLVNSVFSTIIWPYRWFRAEGEWSLTAVAAECTRYATQGLKPPSTDPA